MLTDIDPYNMSVPLSETYHKIERITLFYNALMNMTPYSFAPTHRKAQLPYIQETHFHIRVFLIY